MKLRSRVMSLISTNLQNLRHSYWVGRPIILPQHLYNELPSDQIAVMVDEIINNIYGQLYSLE